MIYARPHTPIFLEDLLGLDDRVLCFYVWDVPLLVS